MRNNDTFFDGAISRGIFSVIKKTLLHKAVSPQELVRRMVNYAAINRRDGALALEQEIPKIKDPFMIKGLQMLIDGQEGESIRELMELEVQYLEERHAMGKKILDFMGANSCPSFAMVGTLIGLVSMLSKKRKARARSAEVWRWRSSARFGEHYLPTWYFFLSQASSANIPRRRKYLWK